MGTDQAGELVHAWVTGDHQWAVHEGDGWGMAAAASRPHALRHWCMCRSGMWAMGDLAAAAVWRRAAMAQPASSRRHASSAAAP